MHASDFYFQKSQIEYEIGKSQSVIKSVDESTEMPTERKAVWLEYEQNRLADLTNRLVSLNKEYWGKWYGETGWGTVIGQ